MKMEEVFYNKTIYDLFSTVCTLNGITKNNCENCIFKGCKICNRNIDEINFKNQDIVQEVKEIEKIIKEKILKGE